MSNNYYHTKDIVEQYIKEAKDFNGLNLIEKLNDYLENSAVLLELGSGPGTDFKFLKNEYNVVGSDFSDEFLSRLKSNNPNDEFLSLDAVTLDTDKTFDAIYSNKVLHHLNNDNLKQSVKRQADILNQQGIICHSFWRGESHEYFNEMFVNYHTEDSLLAFFGDSFNILYTEIYKEFDDDDSIFIIAQKK